LNYASQNNAHTLLASANPYKCIFFTSKVKAENWRFSPDLFAFEHLETPNIENTQLEPIPFNEEVFPVRSHNKNQY
jgi:hypothetical protein